MARLSPVGVGSGQHGLFFLTTCLPNLEKWWQDPMRNSGGLWIGRGGFWKGDRATTWSDEGGGGVATKVEALISCVMGPHTGAPWNMVHFIGTGGMWRQSGFSSQPRGSILSGNIWFFLIYNMCMKLNLMSIYTYLCGFSLCILVSLTISNLVCLGTIW